MNRTQRIAQIAVLLAMTAGAAIAQTRNNGYVYRPPPPPPPPPPPVYRPPPPMQSPMQSPMQRPATNNYGSSTSNNNSNNSAFRNRPANDNRPGTSPTQAALGDNRGGLSAKFNAASGKSGGNGGGGNAGGSGSPGGGKGPGSSLSAKFNGAAKDTSRNAFNQAAKPVVATPLAAKPGTVGGNASQGRLSGKFVDKTPKLTPQQVARTEGKGSWGKDCLGGPSQKGTRTAVRGDCLSNKFNNRTRPDEPTPKPKPDGFDPPNKGPKFE
jgi:hypothetical protein